MQRSPFLLAAALLAAALCSAGAIGSVGGLVPLPLPPPHHRLSDPGSFVARLRGGGNAMSRFEHALNVAKREMDRGWSGSDDVDDVDGEEEEENAEEERRLRTLAAARRRIPVLEKGGDSFQADPRQKPTTTAAPKVIRTHPPKNPLEKCSCHS